MFSISKCPKIMNAPIVLSWPHFLHANTSFIEAVDGMRPQQDKHEFYFDVQPVREFENCFKIQSILFLLHKEEIFFHWDGVAI